MILFVTGTDTDVGKTVVSGALLAAARVLGKSARGIKPTESGCVDGRAADACFLADAAGHEPDCLYRYEPPLAPHAAASESNAAPVSIEACVEHIRQTSRTHEFTLVEGAGGLLVPIDHQRVIADLIAKLNVPALVVARDGLGTINHTSLTLAAMTVRKIKPVGFVFSATGDVTQMRAQKNATAIVGLTGVPYFGRLPRLSKLDSQSLADAGRPLLDQILNALSPKQ